MVPLGARSVPRAVGRPAEPAAVRPRSRLWGDRPVVGVPRGTLRGRVTGEVRDLRVDQVDLLTEVERDLDRLLDVDLLPLRHEILDLREVDRALDALEDAIDVRVLDRAVVAAVRLELARVIGRIVGKRVE